MSDSNPILSEIHKIFGTNKEKETKGIVVKFGKLHVRISRMGPSNVKFKEAFDREWQPYRAMFESGIKMPEDIETSIMHKVYAETILMEWGMENADGTYTEMEYTSALGEKAFRESPDFFLFVLNESKRQENFRTKTAETDSKN